MKKVLLMLIIGWMSVSTVGAQKPSAGLYYYNNECQVYPGQVATICLQVFNTSGGPYQITFQRNAEPPETKVDIPSTPFYWGETIYNQTTFTLLNVKNRFGKKINIDPNNATITFKVYGTGVEELENLTFAVYPNPTKKILNVDGVEVMTGSKFEISDLLGRKYIIGDFDSQQIDVSNLTRGIYILCISNEKGVISSTFLKE